MPRKDLERDFRCSEFPETIETRMERPGRVAGPPQKEQQVSAIRIVMSGRVQGVGFRAWAERRARELGLSGWIRNCRDGTVEAVFGGADDKVDEMVGMCRRGPTHARVEVLERYEEPQLPPRGFQIRASE